MSSHNNAPSGSREDSARASTTTSTPSKKGTAAESAANGFVNYGVAELINPVLEDLEVHCTCHAERILAHFLSSVALDGHTQPEGTSDSDYLKPYLVLTTGIADDIHDEVVKLREILANKKETKRYGQFCVTFNTALQKMHDSATDTLRESDPLNIMFHRNDPVPLKVFQDKHSESRGLDDDVERKPDAVIVSHEAATAVADPDEESSWSSIALDLDRAGKRPCSAFWTREVLCGAEFKVEDQEDCAAVPASHSADSALVPLPPKPVASRGSKNEKKRKQAEMMDAKELSSAQDQKKQRSSGSGMRANSDNRGEPRATRSQTSQPHTASREKDLVERRKQDRVAAAAREAEQQKVFPTPPPDAQCGLYAIQKLTSAPWVTHALNILLIDDNLWIWWYDHQGAIQSQGFNFITSLPHFLLLLLAFQRFSPREWGHSPLMNLQVRAGLERVRLNENADDVQMRLDFECDVFKVRDDAFVPSPVPILADNDSASDTSSNSPSHNSSHDSSAGSFDASSEESVPAMDDLHDRPANNGLKRFRIDLGDRFWASYSMVGRGTTVFRCHDPDAKGRQLVLKASWPETSRESEGRILQYAHHVGKGFPEIIENLPAMEDLYERTFHEHDTLLIRKALDVEWKNTKKPPGGRVPRFFVEEEMRPITKLQGEEFMIAKFSASRCVCLLWSRLLQHTDGSLNNFMCHLTKPIGKMNDWDLAVIVNPNDPGRTQNTERTGTVPYMAMDLLNDDYWAGKIPRLYRHELESHLWVLTWVTLRYDHGVVRKDDISPDERQRLSRWLTSDYSACYLAKVLFLNDQRAAARKLGEKSEWYPVEYKSVALPLLEALRKQLESAESDRLYHNGPRQPQETDVPEDEWAKMWSTLDRWVEEHPDLALPGPYWAAFRAKFRELPDVRTDFEAPTRI